MIDTLQIKISKAFSQKKNLIPGSSELVAELLIHIPAPAVGGL